jgi:hypothetical protein
MLKHRRFPGRLTGTDHQFVIRRANKAGATPIVVRKRFADRSAIDRAADEAFLSALWAHFGEEPFERGNLDAGRLSWLFGREVVAGEDPFDPCSYEAMLRIDRMVAERSFPKVFAAPDDGAADHDWDDDDWADTDGDDRSGHR